MKLLAFSVYDEKSEAFGHPFFTSAIGIASRMMSDWANNKDSMVGRHPRDFKLYHVGYWLDDQAKFDTCQVPILIGHASDFVDDPGPDGGKQMKLRSIENA